MGAYLFYNLGLLSMIGNKSVGPSFVQGEVVCKKSVESNKRLGTAA